MTPPHAETATRWEGEPPAHWQAAWRLPCLEVYDVIGSTNDRARTLAAGGAPAGTLVVAEHQTAGRGRLGRAWHAPHGSSLLLSFLLRPATVPGHAPGTAPLRVGMAAAAAIEEATGVRCAIKWPNDLVVPRHGKVAGVLCEATSAGAGDVVIVAGIGINVRQRQDDWPGALDYAAASLEQCAGRPVDRPRLMAALVRAVRPLFDAPLRALDDAELAAFAARDALRGRAVTVDGGEPCTAAGIDADGAFLVDDDGVRRRITTATLRPADRAGTDWTPSGATT